MHAQDFERPGEILSNLVQALIGYATNITKKVSNVNVEAPIVEQEYIQVKALVKFVDEGNFAELDKAAFLKLKEKLANFYMYFEVKYAKSLQIFEEILEANTVLHNQADHAELAKSLYNLGNIHYYMGHGKKSLDFYLRANEMRERLHQDQDHVEMADSLKSLGITYSRMGDHEKALAYDMKAYEMRARLYPRDHVDVANALNNLGVSYEKSGDGKKALDCFLKGMYLFNVIMRAISYTVKK